MLKPIFGLALPLLAAGSMGCPSTPSVRPSLAPLVEGVCPTTEEAEMCRINNMGPTNLGWLGEGVPMAQVIERLGQPDEVGELMIEEASGDQIQEHIWKDKGVIITAAIYAGEGLKVGRFEVQPPFNEKTARGVGLGSTEAEVVKAYGPVADPHFTTPGEKLVAGSVYGGIFFDFEDGKVTRIFVGAGAE